MNNCAVIGLGFGDEGKGVVTDYLCSMAIKEEDNPLVVRFSGGHQAGHTVMCNGKRHVFSSFGSGTLRGVPTYWQAPCTVDPMGLLVEYDLLKHKNIEPVLAIDPECPVTTPYDKMVNRADKTHLKNGTCGVGFGQTIEREERGYSLKARDLLYPSILKIRLDLIKEHYGLNNPDLDSPFLDACRVVAETFAITGTYPYNGCVIYEGSQGLLLDKNIGFFPHVSRMNAAHYFIDTEQLYLVTRAYQTRHGNGPMSNEHCPHNIPENPHESNKENEFQGTFRRAYLDTDMLSYAISSCNAINKQSENYILAVTCLDQVQGNWVFTHKGEVCRFESENDFLKALSGILEIKKVLCVRSPRTEDIDETFDLRTFPR